MLPASSRSCTSRKRARDFRLGDPSATLQIELISDLCSKRPQPAGSLSFAKPNNAGPNCEQVAFIAVCRNDAGDVCFQEAISGTSTSGIGAHSSRCTRRNRRRRNQEQVGYAYTRLEMSCGRLPEWLEMGRKETVSFQHSNTRKLTSRFQKEWTVKSCGKTTLILLKTLGFFCCDCLRNRSCFVYRDLPRPCLFFQYDMQRSKLLL